MEKWWTPSRWQKKRKNLEVRQNLRRGIQRYFENEGFLEVETPALQVSPGLEPHLMAFGTALENHSGKKVQDYFLHTSPEFAMKKLLAAGAGNIFQFARVYRNREGSHTHHPEFTMLEWYRTGADYKKIMEDAVRILRVAARFSPDGFLAWQGKTSDPALDWQKISVIEAFREYAGIDLEHSLGDGQNPDTAQFAEQARAQGIAVGAADSWDDIFFRVFLEHIETKLGIGVPTILYDYPACMAALARKKPEDPRLAERFEVYVCGMELANAFSELTDAEEQRQRFSADMAKKQALYGFRYPIDEDFLDALETMPAAAGIALGLDRLAMLASHASHIEDVLFAPVTEFR